MATLLRRPFKPQSRRLTQRKCSEIEQLKLHQSSFLCNIECCICCMPGWIIQHHLHADHMQITISNKKTRSCGRHAAPWARRGRGRGVGAGHSRAAQCAGGHCCSTVFCAKSQRKVCGAVVLMFFQVASVRPFGAFIRIGKGQRVEGWYSQLAQLALAGDQYKDHLWLLGFGMRSFRWTPGWLGPHLRDCSWKGGESLWLLGCWGEGLGEGEQDYCNSCSIM